jgi:allophanate hydrolase
MPWGVTLAAPAFCDDRVLRLGARFLGEESPRSGGTLAAESKAGDWSVAAPPTTRLAVCGAHLSGLPLNRHLTALGARLVRAARTSPLYKLYALPGSAPPKPGLVRVGEGEGGGAIEVEVWELPTAAYGNFVEMIPAPLGIGTITLEDGSTVQGFLCEAVAVRGARDITAGGGWRAFLTG